MSFKQINWATVIAAVATVAVLNRVPAAKKHLNGG